ncbi:UPF0598 protein C8orf82 homolog [Dermochelys coriacea]|uniref:UPF0598 protein C8orf82 homolog n=1 Tax=Dermochelys coriacea TaxID=27794 RepID=UPI001CA9A663|nr:UPF0598 protein C8orf82 homolog [Dermochelys coriacea]
MGRGGYRPGRPVLGGVNGPGGARNASAGPGAGERLRRRTGRSRVTPAMRLLRGGLRFLLRPGGGPGPAGPAAYTQGQSPAPRARDYFYYIDHQGQLFLDDAKVKNFITCFKGNAFPSPHTGPLHHMPRFCSPLSPLQ